ncbi:MAG: aldo/keto reductase [Eubacteriales bacterium]|nr:aldo/keto reductase [Eubacteriales bacterium]
MESIVLNNNVKMPLVGLGTWDLRGDECIQSVAKAIKLGYRLIDTAQMYGNEAEVGTGIIKSGISRKELFVTTKIYRNSNSYEKARKSIDESLKNLGLDYVDLLLLHEPYKQGSEMYHALEEALKMGKAKAIGISNYDEEWYMRFLGECDVIPAVNQLEAHVYYQKWNFHEMMKKEGTMMQAWSPLACGIDNIAGNLILEKIGRKYGKSAAQIALRFLVQRGISVIPKSKHESRMIENINILDFGLTDSEMKEIRNLDRNETLFPWTKTF